VRTVDYFENNPVFTHTEFVAAHTAKGRSEFTSNNLLAGHLASGRIIRVRRGLYAVVPRGVDPKNAAVDPYLIATRLTDDAVIAYHGALQFHGKSYSIWRRFHYLTGKRARPFSFRGMEFTPVQAPRSVFALPEWGDGTLKVPHAGGKARVATLERTLVDVLNMPDKCGGWEETWRSLEMVEFFDLDAVIAYAMALDSSLTIARVGFFLEQHRDELMATEGHLNALRRRVPNQPRYLDSARDSGRLVSQWNLIVPESVLNRRWEEGA
jgi:predicted transcriptional regulator of viral defense system